MKSTVHSTVLCNDTLLEIGGKRFFGVASERCEILEDTEVEILDGLVQIKDSEGETIDIVKVRHLDSRGAMHEGWIPVSYIK